MKGSALNILSIARAFPSLWYAAGITTCRFELSDSTRSALRIDTSDNVVMEHEQPVALVPVIHVHRTSRRLPRCPDPIAPIGMTFVSLEPTRIPSRRQTSSITVPSSSSRRFHAGHVLLPRVKNSSWAYPEACLEAKR